MEDYSMRKIMILVAVCLGIGGPVGAHSWYDTYCCNTKDCAPVVASTVVVTPDGWRVTLGPGDHPLVTKPIMALVPFTSSKIRRSQDSDFHVCVFPADTVRCLYVPDFGS
jgi:hypothetical protein